MKESARIAHTYVRSKAVVLGINAQRFKDTDIHLHVPAGATPKDGSSAGLAMASIYTKRPVRSDLGVTGEVTLRGRLLPVGGIKTKILAAHRAGLQTVLIPQRNERDLDELPPESLSSIQVHLVEGVEDAYTIDFVSLVDNSKGTRNRPPTQKWMPAQPAMSQ